MLEAGSRSGRQRWRSRSPSRQRRSWATLWRPQAAFTARGKDGQYALDGANRMKGALGRRCGRMLREDAEAGSGLRLSLLDLNAGERAGNPPPRSWVAVAANGHQRTR